MLWPNVNGCAKPVAASYPLLASFVPVVLWYLLFQLSPFLPCSIRPSVDVSTLPFVETVLFQGLPHRWASAYTSTPHDILAALVYAMHALLPFLCILHLCKDGRKTHVPFFAVFFGSVSLIAVMTHLVFPTAPPWWLELYQYTQPSYAESGNPAGLSRVDNMLNARFFAATYEKSPIVFGSFPSLHAAWPIVATLTVNRALRFWVGCYAAIVWWAAMYLEHHYFVDLLGGLVYVVVVRLAMTKGKDWARAALRMSALGMNVPPSPRKLAPAKDPVAVVDYCNIV
eukprot:ANDGO_08066.mRNA.1 Inositol phosphorylceramide synthase catalytic subunit aur1